GTGSTWSSAAARRRAATAAETARAWLTGDTATLTRNRRAGRPTGAGRRHLREVNELPLVVMVASVVNANGFVSAFARHAHDAAAHSARCAGRRSAAETARLRCRRGAAWLRCRRGAASGAGGACSRHRSRRRRRAGSADADSCVLARDDRNEIVVRDGILELPAQEVLVEQDVQVGRIRVCVFPLEHADRVRVLHTAEDELFFALQLCHLFPDR